MGHGSFLRAADREGGREGVGRHASTFWEIAFQRVMVGEGRPSTKSGKMFAYERGVTACLARRWCGLSWMVGLRRP